MSVITISCGTQSGGEALAERVAERLSYRCISREILVQGATKYNIDIEILQNELQRPPSLWRRLTKEQHRYIIFIRCALLQAASDDCVVYHGQAGQVFLEGLKHVLKVRVEAPLEYRVTSVMQEKDCPYAQALTRIRQLDEQRQRWVKFLYDKELRDPCLYDLIINLANVSLETATDIVCHAAGHAEFQPSDESTRRLADLLLECEVKAAIASDDKLWEQNLQVNAQNGGVVVRGHVKTPEQKKLLDALVPLVKGVKAYEAYVNIAAGTSAYQTSPGHE